ncbi:MAG: anthrone oxygenase family protein [Pseudomonadota bacterium]
MSPLTTALVVVTLIGSALIAGVFFIFSNTVMGALARLQAPAAIAAMQSINAVILNPAFLGLFLGTAACSLLVVTTAVLTWGTPGAAWAGAGALLYFVGSFLVTGMGNVPLNNALAAVGASTPDALSVWEHYLTRWTQLNTLRTLASGLGALLLAVALVVPRVDP